MLILAILRGYRRESPPRAAASGMVLEYLEAGATRGGGATRTPRQDTAPGHPEPARAGVAPGPQPLAGHPAQARQPWPAPGPRSDAPAGSLPKAAGGREPGAAAGLPGDSGAVGNRPKGAVSAGAQRGAATEAEGGRAAGLATGSLAARSGGTALATAATAGHAGGAVGYASATARPGGAGPATATGRQSGAPEGAARGEGRPAPGRGAYQAKLKSLVEAHKEYPLAARRSGREGSCQRRFVLARDGSLQRVESLSSCGHPFLDGAATRAITGVGRFPPLPDEYPGAEESFTVTMTFTLTAR